MNELREPLAIDGETIAKFIKNPYLQLPPEWVPMVWDFWAFFSHLLKSEGELALCTRIRWLKDDDGLTFDELKESMRDCRKPKASSEFQFPSQVLAGLDAAIIAVRRREDDRQRAEFETQARNSTNTMLHRGVVTELAEAFRNPGRRQ